MPLCYEENFRVPHPECDAWDRMMPGAILRKIQEISTVQCDVLGLDNTVYERTHTVFLLSRLSLEIYKAPVQGEQVRMETRAYGLKRAVFHRATALYNERKELLCEADARWVLVDTDTRRILRKYPPELQEFCIEPKGEREHDMNLPKPGELFDIERKYASYTLCDRNGHINNTRYADIVCDHLPLERMAENLPRKMLLYFRSEIPMGQSFCLRGAPIDGGYYFLAEEGKQKYFECAVTYS